MSKIIWVVVSNFGVNDAYASSEDAYKERDMLNSKIEDICAYVRAIEYHYGDGEEDE